MHNTQLEAKVAARNKVNAAIVRDAPIMFAALAPFVGKKIMKADGDSFMKAFADAMPKLGNHWGSRSYTLSRVFIVDENGPRHSARAESSVYFGDIRGGVLVKLADNFNPENWQSFDAAEIEASRAKVRELQKAVDLEKSKYFYFGEDDYR